MMRKQNDLTQWKTQTYGVGVIFGLLVGVAAAYLYNRAAEENGTPASLTQKASTGELIGIGLALFGIVRQISEMGSRKAK